VKPDVFYPKVAGILTRPLEDRHREMARLHDEIAAWYLERVQSITPEAAAGRCAEGRSLAQVVGHIMEWDRYFVISCGEMLAGVQWPGIMAKVRYVEPDGEMGGYETLDEFNARQAAKHAAWPWPRIQAMALDTAAVLHGLFTGTGLLTAARLEATRHYAWRVPNGGRLPITVGWFLWMTILEHEGAEHDKELAPEP
jgi:hypothetical protein